MGYSRVFSAFGRRRPWKLLGSSLIFAFILGCGDIYRPVVTSIPPVQPSSQPTKYAIVTSCGSPANTTAPTIDQICSTNAVPGYGSLVNFSGDTLAIRLNLGNGPRWVGLAPNSNGSGGIVYNTNTDGTVTNFSISTTVESHQVYSSTLLADAVPSTMLSTTNYLYVSQTGRGSVEVMKTANGAFSPAGFLEIPLADATNPSASQYPAYLVGNRGAQRIYAISYADSALPAPTCPGSNSAGVATGIETTTNTPSSSLPLGSCPVYGVMSYDNRRVFVLNEGSGTVSVIDSQQNTIDTSANLIANQPGVTPGQIAVGQNPVWADVYNTGSILAVVNAGSNTLTLINISEDVYGNDSPNFGKIIATVPVGANPSSVSILQDGTRAYVANRGDGTVSIVSLTSNTVTKTIPLPQEPCSAGNPNVLCTIHPMSIAATTGTPTGKVYVVSPDTNVLTIIQTIDDTIDTTLPLTGNGIQVYLTGS
jgi:YVTN family beta-propeller protein